MTFTIYGLKNCDTCKKAMNALEGHKTVFVDIRAEADLDAKLPFWIDAAGAPALVNKRSTTWRQLSEADKAKADTGEAAALLAAHPTLIKRPVIEKGKSVTVGWSAAIAKDLGAD